MRAGTALAESGQKRGDEHPRVTTASAKRRRP